MRHRIAFFLLASCAVAPANHTEPDGGAVTAPLPVAPPRDVAPISSADLVVPSLPPCQPDRACTPDELCVSGICVPRCSRDAPNGACAGGAICDAGTCDASLCRSLSPSEACVLCVEAHDCEDLLACWDDSFQGYFDCSYCILDRDDPTVSACACRATNPACAQCDHIPYLACIEAHCPECQP